MRVEETEDEDAAAGETLLGMCERCMLDGKFQFLVMELSSFGNIIMVNNRPWVVVCAACNCLLFL